MNEQIGKMQFVMPKYKIAAAVGAVLIVALVAKSLLGGHKEPAATEHRDVPTIEGNAVRFSKAFAEHAGIKYAEAAASPLTPIVTVTGTVDFDPQRVAAVGVRIPGRVTQVFKFEGDVVKRGDPLLEVESAELGRAQTAVLSARAQLEAAEANEKREKMLAESHVSSEREAEMAKATASAARAELHAAEQGVRALGGGTSRTVGTSLLTSPIDGKVVEQHVSRGQSVDPTHNAYRIADLDSVWVDLDVFEREVGQLREGDRVEVVPQSRTNVVIEGKVARVGDVVDIETRSAHVRVMVDNHQHGLRPGESVLARIHASAKARAADIVVPRDAVVLVDGRATVFVMRDETSVEPRQVTTGVKDGVNVVVLEGLKAGEKIVTKGVFALKSEVFR